MTRTATLMATLAMAAAVRTEERLHVTESVANALAERFTTSSMSIFGGEHQTWRERRETFLLSKSLSLGSLRYTTVSTADEYKVTYRRRESDLRRGINLLLGWHRNVTDQFAKLSTEIPLSNTKWLIFTDGEEGSIDEDRPEWNVQVDAQVVVARFTDDRRRVELRQCYKPKPGSPLVAYRVGTWQEGRVEYSPDDDYHVKKIDLKGLQLRVTVTPQRPISQVTKVNETSIEFGGLFGLVYNELSRIMNLTSVYVDAVQNASGTVANGKWNGAIGMIQRNETDVIIGPIAYDLDVIGVTQLVNPLLGTHFQIFFKSDRDEIGMDAIFKPFTSEVWFSIVLWTIFTAVIFSSLFAVERRNRNEGEHMADEFHALNSIFVFFQALCQQGHYNPPRSFACRICFFMVYMASIVIITSYSAVLISMIAVEQPHRPFDTLEGFLEKSTHRLLVNRRTVDYAYFTNAKDQLRQSISKKLIDVIPESAIIPTFDKLIEKMCNSNEYALFGRYELLKNDVIEMSTINKCRILHLTRPLDRVSMAFSTHKNSPLVPVFNYHTQKLIESGIVYRLRKYVDSHPNNPTYTEKIEVTIEQVVQVHMILLTGIILSWVVFAAEVLVARRRRIPARHSPTYRGYDRWSRARGSNGGLFSITFRRSSLIKSYGERTT